MSQDEINPFAAPAEAISKTRQTTLDGPTGQFRSNSGRTKWLSIFLVGSMFMDIVAMLSTFAQIALLNRAMGGAAISEQEATANDLREGVISLVQLALILVTAVTFMMWVYRAYSNLPALGATGLKTTPGMAVGVFFIPILNLFRPYQAVSEIYKASDPSIGRNGADTRQHLPGWSVMGWWWTFWIISNLLGQLAFRMALSADSYETTLNANWLAITEGAVSIPLTFLALAVVRRINARQEQKHHHLAGERASSDG
jgi:Domain of unknown function (DUF4328)